LKKKKKRWKREIIWGGPIISGEKEGGRLLDHVCSLKRENEEEVDEMM